MWNPLIDVMKDWVIRNGERLTIVRLNILWIKCRMYNCYLFLVLIRFIWSLSSGPGGLKPHVILGPSDSKKVPSIQPPFHLMSQLTTAHVCFLKSCWAVVEDMKDGGWRLMKPFYLSCLLCNGPNRYERGSPLPLKTMIIKAS